MGEKPEKEAMMQWCDRGPVVTVDSQFPATAAKAISRHIGTCVFPGEKIAVVPVLGAESKDPHMRHRLSMQDDDAAFDVRIDGQPARRGQMETCKHCGRAAPQLQGMLILQRDEAAWYTKCCQECQQKYQCQNTAERERRRKQKHSTGTRREQEGGRP